VLWHYDVELETVTQRRIPPGNPYSPLEILAGDSELLAQHYQVESLAANSWRLVPIFGDSDFVAITLTFDGALPQAMDVLDPLDRTTHIEFNGLLLNPVLSDADFEFVPPAGVDVYQHD
jgi:outer membrane lipoprotein carrier protein